MRKVHRFLYNGLILAATSAFLQIIGILFNSYISGKIGADGMGLFQLVMSVYRFAVTFSLSGISLAATRIVTEALARGENGVAKRAMKRCVLLSLIFGTAGGILLFTLSPFLSVSCLHDSRTMLSMRVLSFALPFVAMSSALGGYFSAVRRVSRSAGAQLFEQFVRITTAITIFEFFAPNGLEAACVAIVIGGTFSEAMSFLSLFLLFLRDKRRFASEKNAEDGRGINKKIVLIAFPVALASYLRSGLMTIEHLIIPGGLKKFGASSSDALAAYGTVTGIALPTVLFPSAFLSAFAGLLIPEMAELHALERETRIKEAAERVIRISLIFSLGAAGILFTFSSDLGRLLSHGHDAGIYIRILAPLVTVMYLDTAVDGMLKGLNQQMASMRYNIIDASICVVLAYTLVPFLGVRGYLLVIYISETINAMLSVNRLISVVGLEINFIKTVLKPVLAILISCAAGSFLFGAAQNFVSLFCMISATAMLYLLILKGMGEINFKEFVLFKKTP